MAGKDVKDLQWVKVETYVQWPFVNHLKMLVTIIFQKKKRWRKSGLHGVTEKTASIPWLQKFAQNTLLKKILSGTFKQSSLDKKEDDDLIQDQSQP